MREEGEWGEGGHLADGTAIRSARLGAPWLGLGAQGSNVRSSWRGVAAARLHLRRRAVQLLDGFVQPSVLPLVASSTLQYMHTMLGPKCLELKVGRRSAITLLRAIASGLGLT